jgi:pectinesterase
MLLVQKVAFLTYRGYASIRAIFFSVMKQIICFILLFCFCPGFSIEKDTLVVALDGTGDYTSLSKALLTLPSFPEKRQVIFLKNGIYHEKIHLPEWNSKVTLLGESTEHTIIRFDDYFDKMQMGRNSTFYTYTFLVDADDVLIQNVTIQNTAGEVGQALALSITGSRVIIKNCRILGNQDTLYLKGNGMKYFYDCYIEGTTDFIFGDAPVFFELCTLHSMKNSYITAASTPKDQTFGFVFYGCKLTTAPEINQVFLGRPWRPYAKTVFLFCELGSHIEPVGWHNWDKVEAELTVFYAEFQNNGPGFQPNNRVKWSKVLRPEEAVLFSKENVLYDFKNWSAQQN